MLTAALKKKMDVQRAVEKRNAAVAARRVAEEGRRKSEERSLHFAGRLLRRSEAEKQMRRPASVGMTGLGGGANGAKVVATAAAGGEKRGKVVAIATKPAKRVTVTKKAKKVSGASRKRKRG